jgi:hypothetical protein
MITKDRNCHKHPPLRAPMGWQERALCLGTPDPRRYDRLERQPTKAEVARTREGMRSCRPCPVRAECLAFGIKHHSSGVYGGQYLVGGLSAPLPRARSSPKITAA